MAYSNTTICTQLGTLGGLLGGTSTQQYQNQLANMQYGKYIQFIQPAIVYPPIQTITEIKKSPIGFLSELRKEIEDWHGNILRS